MVFNATFHNISVISWRILLWYACIIYHTNTSGIDEYILKLQSKDTQTVRTSCFCATAVTCCTKVSWSYSLTWNIQDLNTITSIFNCMHCEIIINRRVLIFTDFVVNLNHQNKSNEILISHWLLPVMCETTNSRTHGSMHFVETTNKSTFKVYISLYKIDNCRQYVNLYTRIFLLIWNKRM